MKKLLLTCTDLMAIQFFTEHIAHWIENGYCVHLACSPVGGRVPELRELYKNEKNVSISELSLQRSPFSVSNVKGYRELKAHLRKHSYDCIVTNEPVMGLVTRLAARKKKTKVVYIAHGFHFYHGGPAIKNLVFRSIEKFAAHYTDCLITINREDHAASKEFCLRRGGKTLLLPGIGVNTRRFTSAAATRRKFMRETLGLTPDEIGIVAIGELNDNKNQQVLIRAMELLLRRCPKAKLFLLGKGDNLPAYQNLAKQCGVEKNIQFLGYRKDVPDVLAACDIGVSASIREGLGLNLIEEMASALPLVASENRGHLDIVVEGQGGILCREDTPQAYAEALQKLCENAQLRSEYGTYNLERCRAFDISVVKEKLQKAIEA